MEEPLEISGKINLGHLNFLAEKKVEVLANAFAVRGREAYLDKATFHTVHISS